MHAPRVTDKAASQQADFAHAIAEHTCSMTDRQLKQAHCSEVQISRYTPVLGQLCGSFESELRIAAFLEALNTAILGS